jgi:hypothetical protein
MHARIRKMLNIRISLYGVGDYSLAQEDSEPSLELVNVTARPIAVK